MAPLRPQLSRLRQGPPAHRVTHCSGGPGGLPWGRLQGPRTHPSSPWQPRAAAAEVGSEGASAAAAAAEVPEAAGFDWFRQWYPLLLLEDADASIPHAAQLLGMDLVLWRDGAGTWRCFEDRCPHRLAALSEGRIDHRSGDLFCNYHGWTFDGTGRCTRIPQLTTEQQAGPMMSSPRACAVRYPTMEAEGLLWVWASAGPRAEQEAAAAEWPGLLSTRERPAGDIPACGWYRRDMQLGYVGAKENSFNDPSHDAVLHHGLLPGGIGRDMAAPLSVTVAMTPKGYSATFPMGRMGSAVDEARFPIGNRRSAAAFEGVVYTVPAAEGRTLYFSTASFRGGSPPAPSGVNPLGLLALLARRLNPQALLADVRWLRHVQTHSVVDADIAIQSSVNRNRARAEGNCEVYMPAEADRGPAACWTWLQRYGGGGPPVSTLLRPIDLSKPAVPRRVLLDRYEQHTRHCRSCSRAHAVLSAMAGAAKLVAAALGAGAAAALAVQGLAVACSLLAAGAAAAALLHVAAVRLVQRFVFVDYDQHHVSKRP